MPDIIHASTPLEYFAAEKLFREYAGGLPIDLGFQDFEFEMKNLSEMYGSPQGALLLGIDDNSYIACAGLREKGDRICELKRMYVVPAFRRKGWAEKLLDEALTTAKSHGYERMRLDTLDSMITALTLYLSHGFIHIPPYYNNPHKNAVYLEKKL